MLYIAPWKKIAIVLLVIVGVFFALPNALTDGQRAALPSQLPQDTVNLGLDLQGGAHVLVEAEMDPVFEARMELVAQEMRDRLRDAGNIKRSRPVIDGFSVTMRITDPADVDRAREALEEIPTLLQSAALTGVGATDFEITENPDTRAFTLTLTEGARDEITEQTIIRSLEVVRRRIDPDGIKEASVTRQGRDRILIQVPGAESANDIVRILEDPAVLGFHTVNREFGQDDLARGRVKAGYRVADDAVMESQKWAISRLPLISGEDVVDAGPGFDQQTGEPIVTFRFNSRAGKAFGNWSLNNVGELFAIVVDGKVISAPSIREPILGGSGQISGDFTVQSSTVLAVQIASGALPARLVPLEQRTVGPELGADSISAGTMASIIGLLLVIVFMVIVYGKFGAYANVALIVNLALILGVLSALGATLTLPGIAGIVLTIGMAVDANVLIFERIREEIESTKGAARAIETGYEKALTAIVDANITTLIAALILYAMGSGPVKGFAVTLGIGIVTSVFTAFFVTRLFVVQWFEWKRPKSFKINLVRLVRSGTTIRFMSGRKLALGFSALAVVASLGLFAVKGLNYGIDFKGGTVVEGRTVDTAEADLGAIRGVLEGMDLGDVQVQGFGQPNDVLIRVEEIKGGEEARKGLAQRIETAVVEAVPDFEVRRVESLGPKVSGELVTAGIMAVLLAIGSVLVYIWLRFEWQFSVGAVAALAHDVILTIGVFSLIGLEFNLSIIAAILTIVGYSLNDTVVVFDRVRENLRRYKKMVLEDLLNLSLNETLSRTLMTSITTLLALFSLYILGGAVLQGFTFAMIWGVIVGTYSSVYIASPVLQLLGVKRDWSKPEDDTAAMGLQFDNAEKP